MHTMKQSVSQHKNQDHAEQENDHFTDLNTITNLLKDLGLVL